MPDPTQQKDLNIEADLAEIDDAIAGATARELDGEGDTPPTPRVSAEELEAEREASKHGWVPKAKFKGDPAKWKPASEFLQAGREFNSVLKRDIERLKSENQRLLDLGARFAKYHEEQMAEKDRQIADTIKQLERQQRTAIREGDDDLADQLSDRMELLREQRKTLKEEIPSERDAGSRRPDGIQPPPPAVVQEWVEDGNEWFRDNTKLQAYAVEIGKEIKKDHPRLDGRPFLDEVSRRMKEDFPRYFKEPAREPSRPSLVEGGGGNGQSSGGSISIHDLPAEDLAMMKDFIAKGWTTKEKFLANYVQQGKRSHRTVAKK